jgi:hydrogenase maturation protease
LTVAETPASEELLIVGCGNPLRGDDAVGLVVARALRRRLGRQVPVQEHRGDGTALLDVWRGARSVIMVDAATGAPASGVARFNVTAAPLPADLRSYSTHAFGVVEAVELARALGELPATLVVYAVYGRRFAYGAGLSAEAKAAARQAIAAVAREADLLALCQHASAPSGASDKTRCSASSSGEALASRS